MIPDRGLPETVTWQRPVMTVDRYDNPVVDWSEPVTSELRVRIDQTSASEVEGQTGPAAFSGWRMLTNELGVAAGHRIIRAGGTYEVDGAPDVIYDLAAPHHLEVRLVEAAT